MALRLLFVGRELLRELGECVAELLLRVALELAVRAELVDQVGLAGLHGQRER